MNLNYEATKFRARELREMMRKNQVDRHVIAPIVAIAEELAHLQHQIKEHALLLQLLTARMSEFMAVGEAMLSSVKKLEKGHRREHDIGGISVDSEELQ
jgi:hypothetical protein